MKTNKKWKQFNFEPPDSEQQEVIDLTSECPVVSISRGVDDVNFEKIMTPKCVEDLAVHKKKIQDVKFWLENALSNEKKNKSSILLLTGPTGCGKTATIKILCKTNEIEISEWINPIDKDFELFRQPGQTVQLSNFLTESKYPSLISTNKSKIALIEDYPNSVICDPSEFFGILEKCYDSRLKVVFICTDASSKNLNLSQLLFPDEIRIKYAIDNICFNACSITLIKQALKNAQHLVETKFPELKIPDTNIIDSIASSSVGDIRCAMNQFQFACLKGCDNLPTVLNESKSKSGSKRKRNETTCSAVKNMNKDENLGLFHSLGRVLNPKRVEHDNSKWKLQHNVDSLIDELCMQPNTFTAFLHENYLKYFGNIEDVSKAADILSLSQRLLANWWDKDDSLIISLWISVMGLMVYNEHKISQWNAICGPKKYKKLINNDIITRRLSIEDICYYKIITNKE